MASKQMRQFPKRSLTRAVLTDSHLWLPVAVLAFGVALLFLLARI
jgi:hypothetical protein